MEPPAIRAFLDVPAHRARGLVPGWNNRSGGADGLRAPHLPVTTKGWNPA